MVMSPSVGIILMASAAACATSVILKFVWSKSIAPQLRSSVVSAQVAGVARHAGSTRRSSRVMTFLGGAPPLFQSTP